MDGAEEEILLLSGYDYRFNYLFTQKIEDDGSGGPKLQRLLKLLPHTTYFVPLLNKPTFTGVNLFDNSIRLESGSIQNGV